MTAGQHLEEPIGSTTTEVTHNYAGWNRLIDSYATEINRRGRVDRSLPFLRFALAASALIGAIGLAIALILLVLPKNGTVQIVHEPQIIQPEIVKPEVVKVPEIVRMPDEHTERPTNERLSEPAQRNLNDATKSAIKAGGVTNYVFFISKPLGKPPFGDVVTAHQYASEAETRPTMQWCYLETGQDDDGRSGMISIIKGVPDGGWLENPHWKDVLKGMSFTEEEIAKTRSLCDIL